MVGGVKEITNLRAEINVLRWSTLLICLTNNSLSERKAGKSQSHTRLRSILCLRASRNAVLYDLL